MVRKALMPVLLLLAACGGGAAGAGSDDAGPAPDASAPEGWYEGMTLDERQCPTDSFLGYDNFGSGFLAEYCRGCHGADVPESMRHGAPLDVSFDSIGDVRAHAARMYARAGDGYTSMPPVGGPSAAARALLGEWLACGAPE
jgi:hypothetical protein